MSSKRTFSLRLTEDLKQALSDAADKKGTTVTALIIQYLHLGLKQDSMLPEIAGDNDSRSSQKSSTVTLPVEDKTEELLYQILRNQRLIEDSINESKQVIDNIGSDIKKMNAVPTS